MEESVANPSGDGGGFDAFFSGDADNLCISFGDFYAILDGEPPPPQPANQNCSLHGISATDTMDSEKVFQQHEEDVKNNEPWLNYLHMDPSVCQREPKTKLYHAEESFDHSRSSSYPPVSNDFFQNSRTGNFDSQQLPRNVLTCSDAVKEAILPQFEDFGNGFYLGDQQRYYEKMEDKIELETDLRESESPANNESLCMMQAGVADSSYNTLTEQSGLSEINYENTGAALDYVGQEKDHFAPMSMFSMDNNATELDVSHPEFNIGEATGSMCNGNSSCLTVQGEYGPLDFDGKGQLQVLPHNFSQNYLPCGTDQFAQNLHGSSSMQMNIQDEFCDTSLSECAVSEFVASSPESLSCEQSLSEDVYLRSESSTDSSPVPSSRNSTSEDVDRYLVDSPNQLHGSKIDPSDKEHSLRDRSDQILVACHGVHKGSYAAIQGNPTRSCFSGDEDDDADLRILENINNAAQNPLLPFQGKLNQTSLLSVYPNSSISRFGAMKYKPHDERLTLRLALQDLSQPKSEASPPDGALAIPLLRHQRIALSWMVQKETSGLHCSGGILADDQGLGKTVSTIALILTERSPSYQPSAMKQDKCETLTLDDDDDNDDAIEPHLKKQPRICNPEVMSSTVKRENPVVEVKTRPAAGTLVVCPTSVLRQWAEELRSKVTSKANLSFLVYHGSNRTKDPNELTKHDVVLTTYAIVSMEVPKSNLDEDDEEKGKLDKYGAPVASSGSKKRKTSNSTSKKHKIGSPTESSLPESAIRPLARVAWFRVILDEAQSIKNYRTQVARACWGLRAKRRWCLSGTPIQNAVEDLYSYFRFLRYDPYAVYKSFCSMIKAPINRNPTNGYKKLQAVLKTVMLRRTKGTMIDGKPIITLPPKTVALKKVDFTNEERAFYSILEAESREQFRVYAEAGTVKQNYVNILLMLLRLRQACDHPLLVKRYESSSSWRTSLEMAKKLPRDRQLDLLSCLQSCSAICTLCNDAPEDAVVTICGHVFCNQCICEHLTGDDSICPVANCRVKLNVTSLFSRCTLELSMNGLIGNCQSNNSGPEMVHAEKLSGISSSYESSKVRAALEILLSLPQLDPATGGNNQKSNGVDTCLLRCQSETKDGKSSAVDAALNVHADSKVTEKAIVFSQWTGMLDLLEAHLKDTRLKYRRLDGTMSVAAREKAVKDFNTNPEVSVMIMSLKAASLGLNMVAACHVLLLDLWWNPTTEDQAVDRAHRIGQTRPVTVSRLTVKDTVEDRILALQEKKREMVASAFGEDKSGTRQARLTVEDLNYLFMA